MISNATSAAEIGLLISRLCTEHRLWASDVRYRVRSRGDENLVVDVADEFIVRVNIQAQPHRSVAVATEFRLLERLHPELHVAVPKFLVVDELSGVVIYRKVPGRPYLLAPHHDPMGMTRDLGELLGTLHRLSNEVDLPHDHHRIEQWLVEATATAARIDPYLPADQRTHIRRFLTTPPPANVASNTLCHNDLGAEHLLIDPTSGALTGIIDWTDAALTDPARDIALIYRDLGPDAATAVARGAEVAEPGLLERAAFLARCKWIEDFAYAIAEDLARERYLVNAHRTFRHTFIG
jgi:aminoglycoside phosphotransferase (APT) family kinase protein